MRDAVARLRRAIHSGETILVHGDYDVDGICATAISTRALTAMGARAIPFVPHRIRDGYDLSDAGIGAARAAGATLILTGDCGTVAHEAILRARRAGIEVIVTDHHTPSTSLPDAIAVVNPNRPDCGYPERGLAGAGVAYKLCCALAEEIGFPEERLRPLLDLVAMATIADLAPLTGENRALVRWGLRILAQTRNLGLRALIRSAGLADAAEISAAQVGFVLAPRLNAVGRMGEAMLGVRLLLSDDAREAAEIAQLLEEENRVRRTVDGETLADALRIVDREFDPARDRGVVLAREGWHPGVIGIVASRVVERIHRPVVLIALNGAGEARGSARSIPGFHLHDAIRDCAEHLVRFGGHRAAAGCSILPERIAAFRAAFDARARSVLEDDDLIPQLRVDLELSLAEADGELLRMLRHAGPFGMGNPTPVFAVRGAVLAGPPRLVGKNHLKLVLSAGGTTLDAIGFGMAERLGEAGGSGGRLDVAFRLEENRWNGNTRLQAKVADFRPAL